jgi:hypothetical protein
MLVIGEARRGGGLVAPVAQARRWSGTPEELRSF